MYWTERASLDASDLVLVYGDAKNRDLVGPAQLRYVIAVAIDERPCNAALGGTTRHTHQSCSNRGTYDAVGPGLLRRLNLVEQLLALSNRIIFFILNLQINTHTLGPLP